MLFGNSIKQLREEQGLLQRQLAAVLGVDVPMFSKIERGDRRAKREPVVILAQQLNANEDELHKEKLAIFYAEAPCVYK